jgi:hypothetical protein
MSNPAQVTYNIPSWSYKTYKARRNYRCANCEGIIPSGTKYLRNVIRLGANKGVDPLRNVHFHLDCTAPWYQPEALHRLKSVGNLPGRNPPAEVYDGTSYYHKSSIAIFQTGVGILQWQPEATLVAKIAFCPKQYIAQNAMAEIEATLQIVLTAITQATGNKRKAMKLGHQIEAIASLLDPIETRAKA